MKLHLIWKHKSYRNIVRKTYKQKIVEHTKHTNKNCRTQLTDQITTKKRDYLKEEFRVYLKIQFESITNKDSLRVRLM